MANYFNAERFLKMIDITLKEELKNRLKEPLMKEAELIVDKIVDDAVAALDAKVHMYNDPMMFGNILEVVTRKKI